MATARRAETAVPELAPRRLLLDTHVWLWWQKNDKKLGARTRRLITSAAEVHLSLASAWEMTIKQSLGKLTLPKDADVEAELAHDGFRALPIDFAHLQELHRLPALHGDPFDRMLVSQARVEALTIVTVDPQIALYDVTIFSAAS